MKTTRHCFFLILLIAALDLIPTARVMAQIFTVLHTFNSASGPNATNNDGANPSAALILSGNTFYGTATYGGSSGWGTVFALNLDGTGFTNLFSFTGANDGANPSASLILSNNVLYGTASSGGTSGAGTVFAINTNGTGFTNLHSFTAPANNSFGFYTNADGAHPLAGLFLSGGILYGAANNGGTSGRGAVFALNTNGLNFTPLHSFSSGSGGAYASAGLVLLGNTLYGTDYGNLGNGTIFGLNTDGTVFTNYYAFTSPHLNGSGILTNTDGSNPHAELIFSGDTLYGTSERGGSSGNGSVFAITPDGTGFATLHSFAPGRYNSSGLYTNSEGANPSARLILSGDNLYGTANAGGISGHGTVFALRTNGEGFTNLYSFSATPRYPETQTNSDGANPSAGLLLLGNSLYGTTASGGNAGNGTVFSLSFSPQLSISPLGTNVVLTWPLNFAGFDYSGFSLQSAPTIAGTFTNIPGATSPYTNRVADAQQFYRLSIMGP